MLGHRVGFPKQLQVSPEPHLHSLCGDKQLLWSGIHPKFAQAPVSSTCPLLAGPKECPELAPIGIVALWVPDMS